MASGKTQQNFSRGDHTHEVSMELFQQNRQRLCDRLKANGKISNGAIVLLQGGIEDTRNDTDHEPLFRQESYFHWTFGVEEPDFYGAIDVDSGKSILFPPKLPSSYAVWMGRLLTEDDFKHLYAVDEVHFSDKELYIGDPDAHNVCVSIKTIAAPQDQLLSIANTRSSSIHHYTTMAVDSVALKLPTFWVSSGLAWFAQAGLHSRHRSPHCALSNTQLYIVVRRVHRATSTIGSPNFPTPSF
ncbi:Xaa-pro dipeptidase [Plakobranchus ocellatus]|uniref:Xaa-pro dipeptidase n=1 Tax=Plakobranchus ocellatus TaxID=259542 RepID=A0AAV4DU88_9GAST|nr:Xaa-pro dipeptidase [Plakobranchus ocellatus]